MLDKKEGAIYEARKRLARREKAEFTSEVNEHFERERNAEIAHRAQPTKRIT